MEIKEKAEREIFIKKYAKDFRQKNKSRLLTQMAEDEKDWRKVEKEYLNILPQILETTWPKERKNIWAMISIIPICPRFLDKWSFAIYGCWQGAGVMEVIMHEICHFLYFKKWQETFPDSDKKTFDSPHLEWHLSEILAPVIISDPRIRKILNKKPDFYEEHQEIKIDKISAPLFFQKIYDEHLENKTSFEDFLKEAYNEIKKHKKLFDF